MSIVLSSFRARLQATERDLAIEALKATHGAIGSAARLCGLHPYQMRRIIDRHHLQDFVSRPLLRRGPRSGNALWLTLGDA